ncbi:MAG: septum formation initiator family protein [Lentisphaerae bacterium]|nr:MAG: septum formation initiator family protein [Lentisphaerota bacterium]
MNRYTFQAIFLFLVLVGGGIWLLPTWQEYCQAKRHFVQLQNQTAQAIKIREHLHHEIIRLQVDKKLIEKIARDKFGWCRPDEDVYDFAVEAPRN